MRTAVVGGGITGLAVALQLTKRNEPVTLFERGSRVGGLVASFELGPTRLEKYFHHIFLSDTRVRALVSELGLDVDLSWKPTPMGFYSAGRAHPFNGPKDLLTFAPLSVADRIRFGWNVLRTKRRDGRGLDALSVKEWVETEWSPAIYAKFWRPLLQGKFGEAADGISAAWLWGRIHARGGSRRGGQEKLGYLRGGFTRLCEAMAQDLVKRGASLRTHAAVSRVTRTADAWEVTTADGSERFDRVVMALPSPQIPEICPDLPDDEKRAQTRVRYQAILCMPIVMDRPLSSIYWLNVGDREIPFTGVIEQTNLVPPAEYGGVHVAYLFNYLPQNHPWLAERKESLFIRYEEGLRRIFPNYKPDQVKEVFLFRDPFATPIYETGYLTKKPPIRSALPGLFFANTAHIFPEDRNMNFSLELAEQLLASVTA